MHDVQGRKYLTPEEARVGTEVQVDGDFTCLSQGECRTIKEDEEGALYIDCKEGHHHLDGQLRFEGKKGYYVGVHPAE